jgi:hypothetical protein
MDFNLKNTKLWFGLAFMLGLVLRLARLGAIPLSDAEAAWALQSLNLVRGLPVEIGPQPGYVNLTALFFFILQSSNFAARLLPALAGSALVLAPLLFRERLGEKVTLALAFALALDPGLVALSRQAGSPILAVTTLILAWGAWRNGFLRLAGFLAGLALLSGSSLWFGALGLGLALLLARAFAPEISFKFEKEHVRPAALFALGTYLVLGSFFLLAPGGLSASLASIPAIFTALQELTDVTALRMLSALVFYQPLALILALVQLGRLRSQRNAMVIFLGFWLFAAILLALAYPARQISHLAWALIPLWVLATLEVVRWVQPIKPVIEMRAERIPESLHLNEDAFVSPADQPTSFNIHPVKVSDGIWETLGMAALTLILISFAWLNFIGISLHTFDQPTLQLRWLVTIGALILLALSAILVAFGWSTRVAAYGTLWGSLTALSLYSLAMTSFSANLHPAPSVEMWPDGPQAIPAPILLNQIDDLSEFSHGSAQALKITLIGIESPALNWLLRDWQLSEAQALSIASSPDLLITNQSFTGPELETAYRGADFLLRLYPGWNQATSAEWLRWIVLHELPQGQEPVLLWARSDLFPDSQNLVP